MAATYLCVQVSSYMGKYRLAVRLPRAWADRRLLPASFLRRVQFGKGPEDCWLWTGSTRDPRAPARWSYRLHKGEPGKLFVCHECDNPRCVNPNHLWLGTAHDNAKDRDAKGRTSRGPEHAASIDARVPEYIYNPAVRK